MWFEKENPLVRNGYFPCEISLCFKSCVCKQDLNCSYSRVSSGKMQIVIVLFILIFMHRPFNYHAIEILSS